MKNLANSGLSMSQAASVSNLCNQRASEIDSQLLNINNCSKTVDYEGKSLIAQPPRPLPSNIFELINEKGKLHATQAFLMENINEKERLLKEKQKEPFITDLVEPEHADLKRAEVIPHVKEDWGWKQLTLDEMADYLEAESYAAHIGQFIHKGSVLDRLRKELPDIKTLEWMTPPSDKAKSYPMHIGIHHNSKDLLDLHEKFASEHRKYEQKVNYFKSKVKNLVTEENARISNINADKQAEAGKENASLIADYNTRLKAYNDEILKQKHSFESNRQSEIKKIAALRINVHSNFKPLVDEFLKMLEDK